MAKLNTHFDGLWEKIKRDEIAESELGEATRRIQDEIFDNRTKNLLIPDALYKFFRSKDESIMARSAKSLVAEYKKLKNEENNELEI
ncbi:MAG: S-4TM family putative pore-forming effector [Pyrinomonadaceae bacterium]